MVRKGRDVTSIYRNHRWTTQRKVFGKPLHSQAVIRSKLAGMISRAESVQNWLENVTYQMCNMVDPLSSKVLYSVTEAHSTVIQTASKQTRRSDCVFEELLDIVCTRYCSRRGTNIWWSWHHPEWNGQVYRALSPYYCI